MIDVIIIGVVAVAALGLTLYLVAKLLGQVAQATAAKDLYDAQIKATDAVIADRDQLTVAIAAERDKSKTLLERLSVAESERNDADRALAAKVGKVIADAPDAATALDALNALLHAHLPGADSAAAGGDSGKAAAVQPAGPAGAGDPGRHA